MKLMVIGASKGLGKAFVEGLCSDGDMVIGVSRSQPQDLRLPESVLLDWIEADLEKPLQAIQILKKYTPNELDVLIYNLGIWEKTAFSEEYSFLDDEDKSLIDMVNVNITSAILVLKHLIPRLLKSSQPRLILTGSTSGLRQSGRPEVTFGASKFALSGIADALRESFRSEGLGVTCLQLGYLNTEDSLQVPVAEAAQRGNGELIPLHDVINLVKAIINMSKASYVRELVLPAIQDERF